MTDATTLGKWIILIGLGLAVLGGLVWLAGRLGWPLGRLPGDIQYHNGNFTFYFPCASSILVSLVLTVLINLVARVLRR
jgi:glucose-6-phosphate dehydrogenase assembly protein OpcA